MSDVGYYRQAIDLNGLGIFHHTLGSGVIANSGVYGSVDMYLNTLYASPIHLPGGARVKRITAVGSGYAINGTQDVRPALYFNFNDADLRPGALATTGSIYYGDPYQGHPAGGACDYVAAPGLYWMVSLGRETALTVAASVGEDGTSGASGGIPFLGFGNALGIGYLGYTAPWLYASGMPATFPSAPTRVVRLPIMSLELGV